MKKYAITAGAISLLVVAGCSTQNVAKDTQSNSLEASKPAETTQETKAETGGKYETYTAAKFDELRGKKPFALYFHATWCGTCNKLQQATKTNLSTYPEGSHFLVADYDAETALKDEFGVVTQTTIVFFDKDGKPAKTLVVPTQTQLKDTFTELL